MEKNNTPMLSLVVPFYNDAGCPTKFVNEMKKELKGIDYELILVDDCSKDSTPKELLSLQSEKVKVIINQKNKDYGGAIQTGLNEAKGNILGFTCGDGEVSSKDIVRVYSQMNPKEHDIYKAIRINRKDGLNRKITTKVFNAWSKLRFGLKIKDINGYPVFFKKDVYNDLPNLKTDWLFNIDLFRKALAKKDYRIGDTTVEHKERSEGVSKMVPSRIAKMVVKFIKYG